MWLRATSGGCTAVGCNQKQLGRMANTPEQGVAPAQAEAWERAALQQQQQVHKSQRKEEGDEHLPTPPSLYRIAIASCVV